MKKFPFLTLLTITLSFTGCMTKKDPIVTISEKNKEKEYPSYLKPPAKNKINTTKRSKHSPNVTYRIVDYSYLPEWSNQYFEQSLLAFKKSCTVLINQPKWSHVCRAASLIKNTRGNAKRFFEEYFQPWVVTNNNGNLVGKVTGYYEPAITGSKAKSTTRSRYPIYGVPYDFVSVPLPQNLINYKGNIRIQKTGQNSGMISSSGSYYANLNKFYITPKTKALKGRFSGNELIPYYTRKEIYQGAINDNAPILAYADDPVELFFLQVQGSGRVITQDKTTIRLVYADKNELPYKSVGLYMVEKGYISASSVSMQEIKKYLQKHPHQINEILGHNPSFIFFNTTDAQKNEGPIGALGVPLTAGYSGAVDSQYIDLGAPLFLSTTDIRTGKALNRLIMAQDTGSAINGSVRVDFFWGYGSQAGEAAGKTNHPGYVWILLPNGEPPM